jgi:L-threonylcarbamoyladenylate synthase
MRRYKIGLLRAVYAHIKNGGIIAYPTEHCFGLGCNPYNYRALRKLLHLKKRNKDKGLIIIAANIEQIKRLVVLPDNQLELNKYWPGQNTLLLPVYKPVSKLLIGKHNKLAIRLTNHFVSKQLCKYLRIPLVSTSANRNGLRPHKTYAQAKRLLPQNVIVLNELTMFAKHPSNIIDFATKQQLR